VDSGATVNTVTKKGWERIKEECSTVIQDITLHPEEILKGYATHRPLEVICSFRAYVGVKDAGQDRQLAKFFVVNGTEISLLGFQTASQLKLLRIGLGLLKKEINCAELVGRKTSIDNSESGPGAADQWVKFPKIGGEPVKFRIDTSVIPKRIIRYNVPIAFEKAVNERLEDMERRQIIERADRRGSTISFVSPMVLVPKGQKDFRMVIDYREVNKAIVREPYPMPSLEKVWADIPHNGGKLFFTKLDLKDAYFHIELHEEVRHLTTFMTANGLMRFTRLPFGLSCAPELFQSVMEKLFADCKNLVVYMDDVLVYGRSLEELEKLVKEVKRVIEINHLTINEEKSLYNQEKVDFLGFTIDGRGILPTKEKISDILKFDRPKDVSEVRSFLGMITFISPFIKGFSHKTKPLRDLLSKKAKFEWKKEQQDAFEELKIATENDLIKRGYFDAKDKTILYTDASPWGLGAVLAQEGYLDGERRIIACASKSLTEVEGRYPQLHREALAIVWAMERFAYYLIGRKFTLRSDSEALMFMLRGKHRKDMGKRIMSRAEGWFLRMEHFCYEFEHVAGKDNIADAASRIGEKRNDPQFGWGKEPHELCLVETEINYISEGLVAMTSQEVQKEQLKDRELQEVMLWLDKKQKWPTEIVKFQPFQREMYIQEGSLMKQEKLVLPENLRKRALSLAHRCHPGMSTMKNILRQGLWWPNMDREVESFVKSCPECQVIKADSHPPPITLTDLPNNPWDYVSIDFATLSDVLHWKALVFTDNYSRFLVAVPIERTDGEAVKAVLKKVFNTYYVPKTIKADNGPPFNSVELQTWLQEVWGVKLIHCTPLNPTENGLVERNMQGINKIAAIAKIRKLNWKEALADYVAAYNSWPHHVTKIPPAELMFGRAVRGLLPNMKLNSRQALDDELRDRDRTAKFERNAREDERRRAKNTSIKVGDKVLVMQQKRDKADTAYKNKFYKVTKMEGIGRATIRDMENSKEYQRSVKHLKKFVDRSDDQESEIGIEEENTSLEVPEGMEQVVERNLYRELEVERPVGRSIRTAETDGRIREAREIKRPWRFRDGSM